MSENFLKQVFTWIDLIINLSYFSAKIKIQLGTVKMAVKIKWLVLVWAFFTKPFRNPLKKHHTSSIICCLKSNFEKCLGVLKKAWKIRCFN